MNKRMKNKVAKREEQQKFANLPYGHGIIIGNSPEGSISGIRHYFRLGTVVKIDNFETHYGTTTSVHCTDANDFSQSVMPQHILIKHENGKG